MVKWETQISIKIKTKHKKTLCSVIQYFLNIIVGLYQSFRDLYLQPSTFRVFHFDDEACLWYHMILSLLSFFLFSAFSKFVLQISFDTHLTSFSSAKKERRMMGGVGWLYTTSTSSIKRSRSCPFFKVGDISVILSLGKKFSSLL